MWTKMPFFDLQAEGGACRPAGPPASESHWSSPLHHAALMLLSEQIKVCEGAKAEGSASIWSSSGARLQKDGGETEIMEELLLLPPLPSWFPSSHPRLQRAIYAKSGAAFLSFCCWLHTTEYKWASDLCLTSYLFLLNVLDVCRADLAG